MIDCMARCILASAGTDSLMQSSPLPILLEMELNAIMSGAFFKTNTDLNVLDLVSPQRMPSKRDSVTYWLKPYGTIDDPVPDTMKFDEDSFDMTFARGVKNIKEGRHKGRVCFKTPLGYVSLTKEDWLIVLNKMNEVKL